MQPNRGSSGGASFTVNETYLNKFDRTPAHRRPLSIVLNQTQQETTQHQSNSFFEHLQSLNASVFPRPTILENEAPTSARVPAPAHVSSVPSSSSSTPPLSSNTTSSSSSFGTPPSRSGIRPASDGAAEEQEGGFTDRATSTLAPASTATGSRRTRTRHRRDTPQSTPCDSNERESAARELYKSLGESVVAHALSTSASPAAWRAAGDADIGVDYCAVGEEWRREPFCGSRSGLQNKTLYRVRFTLPLTLSVWNRFTSSSAGRSLLLGLLSDTKERQYQIKLETLCADQSSDCSLLGLMRNDTILLPERVGLVASVHLDRGVIQKGVLSSSSFSVATATAALPETNRYSLLHACRTFISCHSGEHSVIDEIAALAAVSLPTERAPSASANECSFFTTVTAFSHATVVPRGRASEPTTTRVVPESAIIHVEYLGVPCCPSSRAVEVLLERVRDIRTAVEVFKTSNSAGEQKSLEKPPRNIPILRGLLEEDATQYQSHCDMWRAVQRANHSASRGMQRHTTSQRVVGSSSPEPKPPSPDRVPSSVPAGPAFHPSSATRMLDPCMNSQIDGASGTGGGLFRDDLSSVPALSRPSLAHSVANAPIGGTHYRHDAGASRTSNNHHLIDGCSEIPLADHDLSLKPSAGVSFGTNASPTAANKWARRENGSGATDSKEHNSRATAAPRTSARSPRRSAQNGPTEKLRRTHTHASGTRARPHPRGGGGTTAAAAPEKDSGFTRREVRHLDSTLPDSEPNGVSAPTTLRESTILPDPTVRTTSPFRHLTTQPPPAAATNATTPPPNVRVSKQKSDKRGDGSHNLDVERTLISKTHAAPLLRSVGKATSEAVQQPPAAAPTPAPHRDGLADPQKRFPLHHATLRVVLTGCYQLPDHVASSIQAPQKVTDSRNTETNRMHRQLSATQYRRTHSQRAGMTAGLDFGTDDINKTATKTGPAADDKCSLGRCYVYLRSSAGAHYRTRAQPYAGGSSITFTPDGDNTFDFAVQSFTDCLTVTVAVSSGVSDDARMVRLGTADVHMGYLRRDTPLRLTVALIGRHGTADAKERGVLDLTLFPVNYGFPVSYMVSRAEECQIRSMIRRAMTGPQRSLLHRLEWYVGQYRLRAARPQLPKLLQLLQHGKSLSPLERTTEPSDSATATNHHSPIIHHTRDVRHPRPRGASPVFRRSMSANSPLQRGERQGENSEADYSPDANRSSRQEVGGDTVRQSGAARGGTPPAPPLYPAQQQQQQQQQHRGSSPFLRTPSTTNRRSASARNPTYSDPLVSSADVRRYGERDDPYSPASALLSSSSPTHPIDTFLPYAVTLEDIRIGPLADVRRATPLQDILTLFVTVEVVPRTSHERVLASGPSSVPHFRLEKDSPCGCASGVIDYYNGLSSVSLVGRNERLCAPFRDVCTDCLRVSLHSGVPNRSEVLGVCHVSLRHASILHGQPVPFEGVLVMNATTPQAAPLAPLFMSLTISRTGGHDQRINDATSLGATTVMQDVTSTSAYQQERQKHSARLWPFVWQRAPSLAHHVDLLLDNLDDIATEGASSPTKASEHELYRTLVRKYGKECRSGVLEIIVHQWNSSAPECDSIKALSSDETKKSNNATQEVSRKQLQTAAQLGNEQCSGEGSALLFVFASATRSAADRTENICAPFSLANAETLQGKCVSIEHELRLPHLNVDADTDEVISLALWESGSEEFPAGREIGRCMVPVRPFVAMAAASNTSAVTTNTVIISADRIEIPLVVNATHRSAFFHGSLTVTMNLHYTSSSQPQTSAAPVHTRVTWPGFDPCFEPRVHLHRLLFRGAAEYLHALLALLAAHAGKEAELTRKLSLTLGDDLAHGTDSTDYRFQLRLRLISLNLRLLTAKDSAAEQPIKKCYVKLYSGGHPVLTTADQPVVDGVVRFDNRVYEISVELRDWEQCGIALKVGRHNFLARTDVFCFAFISTLRTVENSTSPSTISVPLFDSVANRYLGDLTALVKTSAANTDDRVRRSTNAATDAPAGVLPPSLSKTLHGTLALVPGVSVSRHNDTAATAEETRLATEDVASLFMQVAPAELERLQPLVAQFVSPATAHAHLRRTLLPLPVVVTLYLDVVNLFFENLSDPSPEAADILLDTLFFQHAYLVVLSCQYGSSAGGCVLSRICDPLQHGKLSESNLTRLDILAPMSASEGLEDPGLLLTLQLVPADDTRSSRGTSKRATSTTSPSPASAARRSGSAAFSRQNSAARGRSTSPGASVGAGSGSAYYYSRRSTSMTHLNTTSEPFSRSYTQTSQRAFARARSGSGSPALAAADESTQHPGRSASPQAGQGRSSTEHHYHGASAAAPPPLPLPPVEIAFAKLSLRAMLTKGAEAHTLTTANNATNSASTSTVTSRANTVRLFAPTEVANNAWMLHEDIRHKLFGDPPIKPLRDAADAYTECREAPVATLALNLFPAHGEHCPAWLTLSSLSRHDVKRRADIYKETALAKTKDSARLDSSVPLSETHYALFERGLMRDERASNDIAPRGSLAVISPKALSPPPAFSDIPDASRDNTLDDLVALRKASSSSPHHHRHPHRGGSARRHRSSSSQGGRRKDVEERKRHRQRLERKNHDNRDDDAAPRTSAHQPRQRQHQHPQRPSSSELGLSTINATTTSGAPHHTHRRDSREGHQRNASHPVASATTAVTESQTDAVHINVSASTATNQHNVRRPLF